MQVSYRLFRLVLRTDPPVNSYTFKHHYSVVDHIGLELTSYKPSGMISAVKLRTRLDNQQVRCDPYI